MGCDVRVGSPLKTRKFPVENTCSPYRTRQFSVSPCSSYRPQRYSADTISPRSKHWRSKHFSDDSHNKVESDYEMMLPQFHKLQLHNKPLHHGNTFINEEYEDSSTSSESDSGTDITSCSSYHYKTHQEPSYVIFDSKNTLLMTSPHRKPPPLPNSPLPDSHNYVKLSELNKSSSDSGFSDIYQNPGSCMTADDVSLISRYDKVLKKRIKKSKFKKLSEFLCYSGGSNSECDEMSDEDSLYDTLDNVMTSPSETKQGTDDDDPTYYLSTEDQSTVRYSKKDFFYSPGKSSDLDNVYLKSTASSEYVLAENYTKYPPSITYSTPVSSKSSKTSYKFRVPECRETPDKHQRAFLTPSKHHLYENVRDFTTPRRKSIR